ncbi:MAG TPA: HesA/MoeB/ThiF family protein [Candidatus Methanofastidiosa archaeon]|nr:HesA/MoeB/ThiF family protein [Candidatus Methanofastidiosa archaeon]HPR42274.1 HesA/MoeB/ThiF family protein [Candidatus Methanofastidiosa archaeon]
MKRYCRNTDFAEIGVRGQELLSGSHAVIVGAGALGGVISTNLVRAGVGRVTICDDDGIDIHNLQRQILYSEDDVGDNKLDSAVGNLRKMNSDIEIDGIRDYLTESNVGDVIGDADIVVDGTDRMEPRYVMNRYCVENDIPYVYGGVLASYGMTFNIVPKDTPCLECIFPKTKGLEHLPTCADVGIVNTVPMIIGSMQATEAMKILIGAQFSRDLIIYDVWVQSFDKVHIKKRDDCGVCGHSSSS